MHLLALPFIGTMSFSLLRPAAFVCTNLTALSLEIGQVKAWMSVRN